MHRSVILFILLVCISCSFASLDVSLDNLIFDNRILNLTEFVDVHPGGFKAILSLNGTIDTKIPKWHLKSKLFHETINKYTIGYLNETNSTNVGQDDVTASNKNKRNDCPLCNVFSTIVDLSGRDIRHLLNSPGLHFNTTWYGLDLFGFHVWNFFDKYIGNWINLWKYFGPVLVLTDQGAIDEVLNKHKMGDNEDIDGNLSTDTILQMIGSHNIFYPSSLFEHQKLKQIVIDFFKKNQSYFENYLKGTIKIPNHFTLNDTKYWTAGAMITFLIGDANPNDDLINAFIEAKNDFNNRGSYWSYFRKLFHIKFGYRNWHSIISEAVNNRNVSLYNLLSAMEEESIPLEQRIEMIEMLFMVGHNNLESSLNALIYRMGLHSYPLNTFGSIFENKFFDESMRLNPPVWLQARRVKKTFDLVINGIVTKIPRGTSIMIPNLFIQRNYNSTFDPKRDPIYQHFSHGPNSCAGKYLAGAIINAYINAIVEKGMIIIHNKEPNLIGGIALQLDELSVSIVSKNL